ncbi:MAG TPA: hypothetical protein PK006_05245 [Saprospiraceae bacterium]|nr:hypothetical protein [Saprospiraceae bacterium]
MQKHFYIALQYCSALIFLISIYLLNFYSSKTEFSSIIGYGILAFGSYYCLFLSSLKLKYHFKSFVLLALIARFICFFSEPQWSEDAYRYYWDGLLSKHGKSPYSGTPNDILNELNTPEIQKTYLKLNSKEYPSIYPPAAQGIFFLSASLSHSFIDFIIILKLLFLSIEALLLFFLYRFISSRSRDFTPLLLLFLNPLWIIEFYNNLHIDLLMISLLILSIILQFESKIYTSALLFGLSIELKILSLLAFPFFILTQSKKQRIIFCSILACILLGNIPFFYSHTQIYFSSVQLFFKQFQFNSFLYHPIIWKLHNSALYSLESKVGLFLNLLFILFLLGLLYKYKNEAKDINIFLWYSSLAFCVYFIFSSTVHPWYCLLPVSLAVMSGKNSLTLWPLFILLSYAHYSLFCAQNERFFINIEYIILFILLIYEIKKGQQNQLTL